ncbi:MAG: hypothetical protein M3460_04475 [Actinomycetota bacterium]|nr:hypothetical protein [Actinomycetota bacterium]
MPSDLPTRAELMVAVWHLTEELADLRDENSCLRQEIEFLLIEWNTCTCRYPAPRIGAISEGR